MNGDHFIIFTCENGADRKGAFFWDRLFLEQVDARDAIGLDEVLPMGEEFFKFLRGIHSVDGIKKSLKPRKATGFVLGNKEVKIRKEATEDPRFEKRAFFEHEKWVFCLVYEIEIDCIDSDQFVKDFF